MQECAFEDVEEEADCRGRDQAGVNQAHKQQTEAGDTHDRRHAD